MSESATQKRAGGVLVTGATGLVGRRLLDGLGPRFAWIRTLSRSGRGGGAGDGLDTRTWDGIDPGSSALDGVDTIVHLAGEPIFGGLPTEERLTRIHASRVDSTRQLVARIAERAESDRPKTLVCASAVGIYPDSGETPLDEDAKQGAGFLSRVCSEWEARAAEAEALGVRVVRIRIGVVLSKRGGALALMRRPFSFGVGGRLGSGRQYFPWIHLDDLVRIFEYVIDEPVEGAINAVAPETVTNAEFTRVLGDLLRRPTILPVPAFVIRLGLGEIAGELLDSKRVVPARLTDAGFDFAYPTLRSALEAELR